MIGHHVAGCCDLSGRVLYVLKLLMITHKLSSCVPRGLPIILMPRVQKKAHSFPYSNLNRLGSNIMGGEWLGRAAPTLFHHDVMLVGLSLDFVFWIFVSKRKSPYCKEEARGFHIRRNQ